MTSRTRKRIVFLCTAVGLVVVLAVGGVTLRRVQRARLLDRALTDGLTAYKARDYAHALDRLGYYVGRRPNDGEAILALAQSRWKIPTPNGAYLVSASRFGLAAAKAMPGDLAPLEMLLTLYQEMGYLTERADIADRILAINPKHLGGLRARAECALLQASKEKAQSACEAWAAAAPDDTDAHISVVEAKRLAGRPSEEIAAYINTVVASHKGSFRFAVFQASTHLIVLNDKPGAIAAIHAALAAEPDDGPSLTILLRLLDNYGLEKDDETLVGGAAKVLAVKPSSPAFAAELASISAKRDYKLGYPINVAERLAPIVSNVEVASDTAIGIAMYLASTAPDATVPPALGQTLAARGTPVATAWLAVLEGSTLLRKADAAGARQKFVAAFTSDQTNDIAVYLLALANTQIDEWQRARLQLANLAADDPSWAIARVSLVSMLLRVNRVSDAYVHASAAYNAHPRLAEGLLLGEAAIRVAETSSDIQIAVRINDFLADLAKDNAEDPTLITLQARAAIRLGRNEEALSHVNRLLASEKQPNSAYVVTLANVIRATDPALATELVNRANAADPQNPDVVFAAARDASFTDPKRGEELLRARIAASQGAERVAYQRHLAVYLERQKDPSALTLLRQIAAENPNDPTAQTLMLDSPSAWSDQIAIGDSIKRYHALVTDDSPRWRVYESRRLLLFSPGGDSASRVVQLLVPVINDGADNAPALALLSEANRILGDNGKAIDYLNRAVDSNPSDPTFYPSLINVLKGASRDAEAIQRLKDFDTLVELPMDLRRERGLLLARYAMWAEAAEDFRLVAAAGAPEDRLVYADTLSHTGKPDEAGKIYAELLASPSPSAPVILAAAEFDASLGRFDEGAAHLDRLPTDLPEATRIAIKAEFFERHAHPEAAEKIYLSAAASGDAERVADLALFYLRIGRVQEAGESAAGALKKHPGHKRLTSIVNLTTLRQGGTLAPGSLAATLAAFVTDSDPGATEQLLRAVAYLDATPPDRQRYVAEITALTRSSPKFYPAWHALVLSFVEAGDADGAARSARAALAAMPDDPRAGRLAAQTLAQCGKLDEALDTAINWSKLPGADRYDAELEIARILLLRDQPFEAAKWTLKWRERIVAEADRAPQRVETYACVLARTADEQGALTLLRPRAEKSVAWTAALLRVARSCTGDESLQRRWYTEASSLAADAQTSLLLASSWYDLGTRSGSPDDFGRVIAILTPLKAPNKALERDTCMLLGSSHEIRKELAEAERYYRRAVDLIPDDPIGLNNLAFVMLTSGSGLPEALQFAERSVQEAERRRFSEVIQASSLDTRASILAKLGRAADAREAYAKALKLTPSDVSLWLGLAEAQLADSLTREAGDTLTRIDALLKVQARPNDAVRARIDQIRSRLSSRSLTPGAD